MNDRRHVLILGGGTGGTITANRLRRMLPPRRSRADAVQRAIANCTVHNTLLDPSAVRIGAGVSTHV